MARHIGVCVALQWESMCTAWVILHPIDRVLQLLEGIGDIGADRPALDCISIIAALYEPAEVGVAGRTKQIGQVVGHLRSAVDLLLVGIQLISVETDAFIFEIVGISDFDDSYGDLVFYSIITCPCFCTGCHTAV